MSATFPSFPRRGGCAINKKAALPYWRSRGG
jgi:hypothetical protein